MATAVPYRRYSLRDMYFVRRSQLGIVQSTLYVSAIAHLHCTKGFEASPVRRRAPKLDPAISRDYSVKVGWEAVMSSWLLL